MQNNIEAESILCPHHARMITNGNNASYKEGRNSDGERGLFFDAVTEEGDTNVKINSIDVGLPTSMGGDGTDAVIPSD